MALLDTTPGTLLAAGQCYACYGLSTYEIMKTVLLSEAALAANPAADVTPAGLLEQAKCFNCVAYANIGQMFELALLNIIAQAG